MSEILDSGARREFSSGAVRDVAEGKGRCDLLPLKEVAKLLADSEGTPDLVLQEIGCYVEDGNTQHLVEAIKLFCKYVAHWDVSTCILEVSKHYEEGALKYSERNWEKGIDLHCFIDSGVRHYLKNNRDDKDESHDRAFVWNMLGAIWTHDHRLDCHDLPFATKNLMSAD